MSFFFSDIGSCNKFATNIFNALAFISRALSESFQGREPIRIFLTSLKKYSKFLVSRIIA